MEAAMPCKMGTRKRKTEPQQTAASRITESNKQKSQKLHALNPRESVWNLLYQEVMKITSLKKGSIQKAATTKSINLFRCQCDENFWHQSRSGQRMAKARKVASVASGQGEEQKKNLAEHRGKKKVNSVSLMDTCHLKNAELKPKHQKYKGWVVLRSDMMKDDSSPCAVFTEQRSSASQVTADVIARLPDCAGQAADAISAYTQVKMEDAPTLKKSKVRMSRYLDTSNKAQMAKIMVQYGRPSLSSWAESAQ